VPPNEVRDADRAWLELVDASGFLLQKFADVVELAAKDWTKLEQLQQDRNRRSQA